VSAERLAYDPFEIVPIDGPTGKPPTDYDPNASAAASISDNLDNKPIASCTALGAQ
jgi:hypothetical protein